MTPARTPAYALRTLQEAVRRGAYWITRSAGRGAAELYLDESDIVECVQDLTHEDFFKSMPSEQRVGSFQDVYRGRYRGFAVYVKLQLSGAGHTVVVSFKRDESA